MASKVAAGHLPPEWRVRLPVFEGPLDLLLHLVRINEVEISDIPVALVCDQFHEYLGLMEDLSLDIAAEYVYEAALLVHLKSKMLLPRPRIADGSEVDPREELVARLLEYQKLKAAAQSLAEIHSLRRGVWTRQERHPRLEGVEEETVELGEVSLVELLGAFKEVLARYDREHPPPLMLHGEDFSVRDQFERILDLLVTGTPLDLIRDLQGRSCRGEAVAAFLAVLELVRMNLVRLHQTRRKEVLLYRTSRQLDLEELEAVRT
jgi:segregation and condensation protein A